MSKKKELKFSEIFDYDVNTGDVIEVHDESTQEIYKAKILAMFSYFGDTVDEIELENLSNNKKERYNRRNKFVKFFKLED